jgi:hypothetical protein
MMLNATFNNIYITKVASSKNAHGEVYSIQQYVSDLRKVGGFSSGTQFSSTNKTYRHDITEISLIVSINIINQNHI